MASEATVVVVHGLWMTGAESFLLQRHVAAQTGWNTVAYRYRSVRDDLDEIVRGLSRFISKLPAGPVHIVAHSLGGVVTYRLAHTRGLDRAGRAVLLCSPIQGSEAARRFAQLPLLHRALGKAVGESLLPHSRREWSAEREAGVIAGTRSVGMGKMLGLLPRPNDGTVALCETALPGARDTLELPVTHSGVLFSTEVAAQAAFFLRHGRFRRAADAASKARSS